MENKKTEKKRIFSKLTVCVAALALVSCAFVGGTFARYTSQGVIDNGGSNIADWYIDVDNGADTGDGSVMLTISPYHEDYDASGDRVNEVAAGGTILTITNRGEVAADVTLDRTDDIVVDSKKIGTDKLVDSDQLNPNSNYTDIYGNRYTWTKTESGQLSPVFTEKGAEVDPADYKALVDAWEGVYVYDPAATDAKGIITIGAIDVISSADNQTVVEITEVTPDTKFTFTLQPGQAVEVTMEPTSWKTDFDNDEEVGSNTGIYDGDIRDTWIGQNIARVGYGFSWTAVQASTAPNADGGSVKPAPEQP